MLAPNKTAAALADKNTELALRLKVAEEQLRLLREENQRLKALEQAHKQLKDDLAQKSERTVLLEEELRWLKAQYYGRSIQKSDLCEGNPDQQMLFNEAEVLAAIEAADQATPRALPWLKHTSANARPTAAARRCRTCGPQLS